MNVTTKVAAFNTPIPFYRTCFTAFQRRPLGIRIHQIEPPPDNSCILSRQLYQQITWTVLCFKITGYLYQRMYDVLKFYMKEELSDV